MSALPPNSSAAFSQGAAAAVAVVSDAGNEGNIASRQASQQVQSVVYRVYSIKELIDFTCFLRRPEFRGGRLSQLFSPLDVELEISVLSYVTLQDLKIISCVSRGSFNLAKRSNQIEQQAVVDQLKLEASAKAGSLSK